MLLFTLPGSDISCVWLYYKNTFNIALLSYVYDGHVIHSMLRYLVTYLDIPLGFTVKIYLV